MFNRTSVLIASGALLAMVIVAGFASAWPPVNKTMYLGFTERVKRPVGLSARQPVSFGEAPPGVARPIIAWYPKDQSFGHKFLYPDQAR